MKFDMHNDWVLIQSPGYSAAEQTAIAKKVAKEARSLSDDQLAQRITLAARQRFFWDKQLAACLKERRERCRKLLRTLSDEELESNIRELDKPETSLSGDPDILRAALAARRRRATIEKGKAGMRVVREARKAELTALFSGKA